jgi:alkanesulfonate monooxygenase SsuD/methylene tetrahydromethanopterin reductase-like flavin-dependent oxidoreductase (luciferase family)
VVSVTAGALSRRTHKGKILILGSPLPHRNPVRVAEEIAMLDCITGGRIVSGFVRGVPTEIHPANTNPVLNRERFQEAHDLIIKAWKAEEAFNWEGKHFHYRYVNPWPRTFQQPHPPIWITGSSKEHVPWVADREYVFATLLQPLDQVRVLFDVYRERCAEQGLPAPTADRFAYLAICYTAETDEQARQEGEQLLWYLRQTRHPGFWAPPGYASASTMARMLQGRGGHPHGTWDDLVQQGVVIGGSPESVIKQIRHLYETVGGVGHLLMMNQAGFMSTDLVRKSLRLFAQEVLPAVRELGAAEAGSTVLGTAA